MPGHSSRIGLGRVRTSALEAVVYLCSMRRNVRRRTLAVRLAEDESFGKDQYRFRLTIPPSY